MSQSINTALISRMTFEVPWEELQPGPIGEYVEVIDYDPPTGCFYQPVNLDDPILLGQDGHSPTEGNPQFHQQMVYAVAMTTINTFEKALGRPAMWADGPGYSFVQRLRIYPHALREANAYYSHTKKSLLFGYFPASNDPGIGQFPGGMVFTCLSHDIIAHETAHALLDGFHPGLLAPTNDDVLAFHEAFSDIVALFQRFTFRKVLAHQIASTQGDLREPSMMAKLATQFGQAIGGHGALRDAIGHIDRTTGKWQRTIPDPGALQETLQPHARGSILVAAVFDAFVQIYRARTADLIRIASGGTGVLPEGEIHPDLVNRLADEAAQTASHVLRMCIRALDYCPPIDLTFGEFLRAVITADIDLMPEDRHGYRVAFIEAFKRRGIFPIELRTFSEDNLRWDRVDEQGLTDEEREALKGLLTPIMDELAKIRKINVGEKNYRRTLWTQLAASRRALNKRYGNVASTLKALSKVTGLAFEEEALELPKGVKLVKFDRKFEVRGLSESRRVADDGRFLNQVFLTLIQDQRVELDGDEFTVECGSTIVLDLDERKITYLIRKSFNSRRRLTQVFDFKERHAAANLSKTYFGDTFEELAALHRSF